MDAKQKILLLGATGLLGTALYSELSGEYQVIGCARKNADIEIDVTNDKRLEKIIKQTSPDIILNTVAIVDHHACEINPGLAYIVNTKPISIITNTIKNTNTYFIQISTDHYYKGDIDKKHKEEDSVVLPSEYSRTKYLAEQLTKLYPNSLVARTNIVGFKKNLDKPSFVDWVFQSLQENHPIILYNDFYTSSIHTKQLAKILKKIIPERVTGVLNIASSEVFSKKKFIEKIAHTFSLSLKNAKIGSCQDSEGSEKRGNSLGLDTTKAQSILGHELPNLDAVAQSLFDEYSSSQDRSKA